MEHLNRQLKYMIGNLHSNIQPVSTQRVARSLRTADYICQLFSEEAEALVNKGYGINHPHLKQYTRVTRV